MSLADLCAAAAVIGLIAYGVLGGADFGGGVWDLLASGPRKQEQRAAIAHAMGPVWEANHVWLIFVIVVFFTAFPVAYAAYATALFGPLRFVLVGITLRGVAFVFRAYAGRATRHGTFPEGWSAIFGASSLITPFLLGMSLGAVSQGGLRIVEGQPVLHGVPWLSGISLAIGAAACSLCAYLAAVFLCLETTDALREDFRTRALLAGTVVVAGSVLTIPFTYLQAPHLWEGLLSPRALPVLVIGGVAALLSGYGLWKRHFRLARLATVVQVAMLVTGWALAQYPYLIYPDVTLAAAAAPAGTLSFLLWTLPFGLALVGPSMWLLLRVFKGQAARLT